MYERTLWYMLVARGGEVVDSILVHPRKVGRKVSNISVGVRKWLGDTFTALENSCIQW